MKSNKKSKISNSLRLYKKAGKLIPGHTQLISRRSSQFAHGVNPIYASKSEGSRFVDVDGNTYLDWVNAVSAIILGHSNPEVNEAVKLQIDQGSIFTVNSPLEIELAELLVEHIPSAEMVRYTKGGGEACALAVRIARGVTGKDKVVFSGYHGWHDWYQSANYLTNPNDGEYPFAGIEPIGIPRVLSGTAIPFSYGDLEQLEFILNNNKNEVAAVMLEPMRSDYPDKNYLRRIKEITKENNAILIFDEVTSGWRISIGGVQKALNVTPDMSVFSKAMSNGYPMGAVVGSTEIMAPAERMFISSSYWSDNIGLAASVATIKFLNKNRSEKWFRDYGTTFKEKLNEVCDDFDLEVNCAGTESSPYISFGNMGGHDLKMARTLCIQEMAKRGIHTNLNFHPTMAHSDKDIKETASALFETLKVLEKAINSNFENFVETPVSNDPFRRLVN